MKENESYGASEADLGKQGKQKKQSKQKKTGNGGGKKSDSPAYRATFAGGSAGNFSDYAGRFGSGGGGGPARSFASAGSAVAAAAMAADTDTGSTPVSVFKQCEADWNGSGHPFTLKRLLDGYQEVSTENSIQPLLERGPQRKSIFLHDYSGVGTHLLGMYLISEWEKGNALNTYEQVLWLPYNQLVGIFPSAHEQADFSIKPSNLIKLMGQEQRYDAAKKTVLVVTGVDCIIRPTRKQEPAVAAICRALPALLSELPFVMIGNHRPAILGGLEYEVTEITLPSVYAAISQVYPHDAQDPDLLGCLMGEEVIDEITQLMRRMFYFDRVTPKGVVTFSQPVQGSVQEQAREWCLEYTQRLFPKHVARPGSRSRSRATSRSSDSSLDVHDVRRCSSPWSPGSCAMMLTDLRRAQAKPPSGMPEAISNPAQWYLAAVREGDRGNKFSVYDVSGHVIVVRGENHYVTDLGPSDQLVPQRFTGKIGSKVKKMPARVKNALVDAQGSLSDAADSAACFMDGEEYVSKAHKQAHDLLQQAPGAALHSVMQQTTRVDLSYTAIQKQLTEVLNHLTEEPITQAVQDILYGVEDASSPRECRDVCRLLVSVLMFGEVAREEQCFFALFAMISLFQDPMSSYTWRRFVALPTQVAVRALASKSWKDYVLTNAAGSLGGAHPMAHNGSFIHVREALPAGAVSWPHIKMQMLYLSFIKSAINGYGQGGFSSLKAGIGFGFDGDVSRACLFEPVQRRQLSDDTRSETPLPDGVSPPSMRRANSDPTSRTRQPLGQLFQPALVREDSEGSCASSDALPEGRPE